MKRIITILTFAATFGLALPTLSEAAPRKGKQKNTHVSASRSRGDHNRVAFRGGDRSHHRHVVASPIRRGYYSGPSYVRSPFRVAPAPYYRRPGLPLFSFLFRL